MFLATSVSSLQVVVVMLVLLISLSMVLATFVNSLQVVVMILVLLIS